MSIWKWLFSGGRSSPLGVTAERAWDDFQEVFLPVGEQPEKTASREEWRQKRRKQQAEISRWVETGGNIHWACRQGMTMLHYAAMRGNEDMVRFLLDHGASVNARAGVGAKNRTPLLLACANTQTSVIPILLERGADPNAEDSNGCSPLMLIQGSSLAEAKRMAELIANRGAKLIPGKTSICPECGAPDGEHMGERGVHLTFNGAVVKLTCPSCSKENEIPLGAIDKSKGVQAGCPSCRGFAFVPPSVWCGTCGIGLSTGWQRTITRR